MKSLSFQTSSPNGKLCDSMYFPDRIASCLASSDGHENSSSFHANFSCNFLPVAQTTRTARTKINFIFTRAFDLHFWTPPASDGNWNNFLGVCWFYNRICLLFLARQQQTNWIFRQRNNKRASCFEREKHLKRDRDWNWNWFRDSDKGFWIFPFSFFQLWSSLLKAWKAWMNKIKTRKHCLNLCR